MKIRDLAIIDELELALGPGLNVLTGETGAGKSILVGALELVLGAKARPDLVRSGARDAEVEACFDVRGDEGVQRRLEANGLTPAPELVVRRVIAAGGRGRAFVNGQPLTRQRLAELAKGLADISSQHEHHTLSDPSTHLGYLDAFAGATRLRARVAAAYHALVEAHAALSTFESRLKEREARRVELAARVEEIEAAAPEPGEDVELERTCARLRGMETLLRLTGEAAELLYDRDDSLLDGVARAGQKLERAGELEPGLLTLAQELAAVRDALEDVARALRRHIGDLRADPGALARADERLHQLRRLERRYGDGLEAVIACLEQSRAELEALSDPTQTSEALAEARAAAFTEAERAARALSAERRRAAERLSLAISRELDSLGMGGAKVLVEVKPVLGEPGELSIDGARLSAQGLERAELLIAPNRGEEARPLHRVASGGELSRAMLAIKCVLAELGPAGMYAFDEVDTGVGGGMAEIIGRKIRSVARHRQVLCITHLPQIAAFADQHFKVEKLVRGERTTSQVRKLSTREQGEEIARMLGGVKITAKTRAVARELLRDAKRPAA